MNEYKEFQITLPISGEIIMRNSEGIYASKSPEIDVEIVVDKDYVIDALVQSKKEEMKFYEVHDPYYALIKAKTEESAMTIYTDVVAEEGELVENIKEVTGLYAAAKYSRCTGEDNKTVPIEEVLEDLTSEEEMVLIIDGSLL